MDSVTICGRCETCKQWRAHDESYVVRYPDETDWGVCGRARYLPELQRKREAGDLMVYWDDESYCAHFETHKTFGCIAHERREGGVKG